MTTIQRQDLTPAAQAIVKAMKGGTYVNRHANDMAAYVLRTIAQYPDATHEQLANHFKVSRFGATTIGWRNAGKIVAAVQAFRALAAAAFDGVDEAGQPTVIA